MGDKDKSGFQSSAGLIRYFDSEDEKSIKLSPYLVMGVAIGTIIVVTIAGYIWPV
ncbi:MAG: Preprotein translocase subunit SecG [Methanomassiliicoccales archaeon PtaU1.Bin124]|nr:MAG: Preprotein translocase subunit SecG [Methanomassiliicoccales archaeon PtaU1.Bin124]